MTNHGRGWDDPALVIFLDSARDAHAFRIASYGLRLSGAHDAVDLTLVHPIPSRSLMQRLLVITYRNDWVLRSAQKRAVRTANPRRRH